MSSTLAHLSPALRPSGPLALLFSLAGSGLMAVSLLGCGLNSSVAQHSDPFLSSDNEPAIVAEAETAGAAGRAAVVSDIQTVQHQAEAPAAAPALPRAPEIARAPGRGRAPQVQGTPVSEGAIERLVSGPREIIDGPENCPTGSCPAGSCPPGDRPSRCLADGLPCPADDGWGEDEYLCDGGDRDYPVHYEAGRMAGLNTEDAVVEYNDSDGNLTVTPTCKVCLYAPRFSAITAINEPNENHTSGQPIGAKLAVAGSDMIRRQLVTDHHQRDRLTKIATRKRGSQVFNPLAREEIHNLLSPEIHDQTLIAFNHFTYVRTGILVREEEARLKLGIQGAANWTRVQNPVIAGHLNAASQVESRFRGVELVGREPPSKPGVLKICKLADRRDAQPGDIVTFTIRYDNLGDLPVTNVQITDNLTPRMEYVPDSAMCDRPGKLVTEDNNEGSLILRWILDEPVLGHTGGTVSFKAKVR